MLTQYFPVLIFMVVAVALGVIAYTAGGILGPHRPYKAKLAPYECGFDHFEDARLPFDVRFYLVAILFIIFDLETAFIFPWALVLRHIGWAGFAGMMLFLGILIVGFIYEWKKGALEWE
jgi:NADH-quinone oxidoreductase subunit A